MKERRASRHASPVTRGLFPEGPSTLRSSVPYVFDSDSQSITSLLRRFSRIPLRVFAGTGPANCCATFAQHVEFLIVSLDRR
jgi:hypothetical protein